MPEQSIKTSVKGQHLLTPAEAAKRLNVVPVTLRKWAQNGLVRAIQTPGGHRRYTVEEIERFAREYNLSAAGRAADKLRLLIVDDDKQLLRYLDALFETLARHVIATQSEDGFDAGRKVNSFQPDVLLLDLMMPGIDGYEVCRQIKSDPDTRHIRVIAMTGYHSNENRRRIMQMGAEACLQKPLDRKLLLETIGIEKQIVDELS